MTVPDDVIEKMADATYMRPSGDRDAARYIVRAALRAAARAGYVLAPVKATKEMHSAGWAALKSVMVSSSSFDHTNAVWSEMLAARPDAKEETP